MAGKIPRYKATENPIHQLRELKAKFAEEGIQVDQYNIQIEKKGKGDLEFQFLANEQGVPLEEIATIQQLLQSKYGPGKYKVFFSDPNTATSKHPIIEYIFNVADPNFTQDNVVPVYDPMNPMMSGMPPMMPGAATPLGMMPPMMGMANPHRKTMSTLTGRSSMYNPYDPYGMNPYFAGGFPMGRMTGDDDDNKSVISDLRKEIGDMKTAQIEERNKHDRDLDRERADRERREDRDMHRREMDEIKRLVADSGKKDDGGGDLMKLWVMSSKDNMSTMTELMKRDQESARLSLEESKERMKSDAMMQKEYLDRVVKLNDPKQTAEFMNIMGQGLANQYGLLSQLWESGMMGEKDDDPSWMKGLREVIQGLSGVGQKFFDTKQQEMRMRQKVVQRDLRPIKPMGNLPPQGQQQEKAEEESDEITPTEQIQQIPAAQIAFSQIAEAIQKEEPPEEIAELFIYHYEYMMQTRTAPAFLRPLIDRPEEVMEEVLATAPISTEFKEEITKHVLIKVGELKKELDERKKEEEEKKKEQKKKEVIEAEATDVVKKEVKEEKIDEKKPKKKQSKKSRKETEDELVRKDIQETQGKV